MTREPIRILLADDHLMVRMGLKALINTQADMTVVAEAASGARAVEQTVEHRPDVILLDLRMPGVTGIEAIEAILSRVPGTRIMIVTTFDDTEDIYRALQAGARAYLLKNVGQRELLGAIRAVARDEYRIPPEIAGRLSERLSLRDLTARETEVLQILVKGNSNKEIASSLNLSENTVKNHLKMVFDKLNVKDRTQAVTTALQRGLVQLK